MILKKIDLIINFLLEYFVKLNFNRKKKKFNKIYENEFALFFNDTIAKEISIHGIYEKDEIDILSKFIKKNKVIIDIGANIGNHSIAFSKFSKKVYAFEAHPRTFEILKFNCSNFKKIKLFNIGISDKKGILFFKKKKTSNIGGYSLSKLGTVKSKIQKLDSLIKLKKEIELIKIDIEGHEYQALIGMKKIIKNNNCLLMVEFFDEKIKKRREITNFLKKNGFTHFYYFERDKKIFKKNYLNLIKNIFDIIFLFKKQITQIKEIDQNALIHNNIKSNVVFSKSKLNLQKLNNIN